MQFPGGRAQLTLGWAFRDEDDNVNDEDVKDDKDNEDNEDDKEDGD
jgi:hypothetical protein